MKLKPLHLKEEKGVNNLRGLNEVFWNTFLVCTISKIELTKDGSHNGTRLAFCILSAIPLKQPFIGLGT